MKLEFKGNLKSLKTPMNRPPVRPLSWTVALWLGTQVFAQSAAPTFPDPGKPHMSRDDQRSLGLQAAAQVYQQMPVLPDSSPETQYIRQLGQKLVATIPPENSWPFEFHVVAQKEINAFALPGGPMFVNIGTITAAANEAQLAGVMGHEMSHVYMQHSAKQAGKEETTGLLAGIAAAALGGTVGNKAGGLVGQLGQMGIQMGAQGLMMKYSRTDESQADAVGTVILYKAGYNPQAMADFFKTLESQGGPAPPQFFSDHPNPGNRQQAIEKEIAEWPAANYATDSPAFQATRKHAMGVKAYTAQEIAQGAKSGQWAGLNKQNGATFNPTGGSASQQTPPKANSSPNGAAASQQAVLPSQQMVAANLGPATIRHPENWQVKMPEQKGQFVTIAPQAGITQNGVGYGVLVNAIAPPQGGRKSIDDITSQLVKDMQQNNRLEPLGNAQPIAVGSTEGRSVVFHSASPIPAANGQAQLERDWLVTVPKRDGSVVFMIFVAPQSEFAQFQPTYEAMLKSIQIQ
jgi:Zn-dependent protease with chaperone function